MIYVESFSGLLSSVITYFFICLITPRVFLCFWYESSRMCLISLSSTFPLSVYWSISKSKNRAEAYCGFFMIFTAQRSFFPAFRLRSIPTPLLIKEYCPGIISLHICVLTIVTLKWIRFTCGLFPQSCTFKYALWAPPPEVSLATIRS